MTDAEYLNNFLDKIKTKEDLINILNEIATIKQIIFKNKDWPHFKEELKNKISIFFEKFVEGLEKIKLDPRNLSFWEDLERKLKNLDEIRLEIAFQPTDSFVENLSEWLKKELGRKIILDIKYNPKIVAGAIVEFKGKWADFSIAKEIDKLYENL